jgi:hypothetical protein
MKMPSMETEFSSNGFACRAYSKRSWLRKEDPKTGEAESIRLHHAGIVLTAPHGEEIKFTYHRGTFGDSRRKDSKSNAFHNERLKIRELIQELSRMIGEESANRLVNMATY